MTPFLRFLTVNGSLKILPENEREEATTTSAAVSVGEIWDTDDLMKMLEFNFYLFLW